MKILFCSHCPLSKELGASKTLIELAKELENLGWSCKVIAPSDLDDAQDSGKNTPLKYAEQLRRYLHQHAAEYDIIDYDNHSLPYPRADFHPHTLFVARSQLLAHHWKTIKIPKSKFWKSKIRYLIYGIFEKRQEKKVIQAVQQTCEEADLVIVLNYADKKELVTSGIGQNKIRVVPNGMSQERRYFFDAVTSQPPLQSKVAFVGTFDNRKGATDFPEILKYICEKNTDVSFRLLGTYLSKERVLASFPNALRNRIEVIPHFFAEDLPELLSNCSVGIFPSYIEGFGLGVLEMLAASIPVIAYDSPGPPMMLPPEYLVSPGDAKGMSEKVISLLNDKAKLTAARLWAKEQSQQFSWHKIAKKTSEIYLEAWKLRQSSSIT